MITVCYMNLINKAPWNNSYWKINASLIVISNLVLMKLKLPRVLQGILKTFYWKINQSDASIDINPS